MGCHARCCKLFVPVTPELVPNWSGYKSDSFLVGVGLSQGCSSTPMLCIIFMNRIVRTVMGHIVSGSVLTLADDVVLLVSWSNDCQLVLEWFVAGLSCAHPQRQGVESRHLGSAQSRARALLCQQEAVGMVREFDLGHLLGGAVQ